MIKTYLKTLWRMFEKHVTRLLSILFMVLVSVGFCSGIGIAPTKIDNSLDDYYVKNNVGDFIVRSKSVNGFTSADIENFKLRFGEKSDCDFGFQLDVQTGEKRSVRLYFLDFENWTVNVPDVVEGEKQDGAAANKIYAERSDNVIKSFAVGEKLDLAQYLKGILPEQVLNALDLKTEVCAVVQGPLTFAVDGEPSDYAEIDGTPDSTTATADADVLEQILYVPKKLVPFLPYNALYVAHSDRASFSLFSGGYKNFVTQKSKDVASDEVAVLTLYDNYSFVSLDSYSAKVEAIGFVLMVAFLLVTALVVLSTMTRLLDEERAQIACLKTLGYSSTGIISKYLLFALIATGIGGAGAYFVGIGLAYLLYFVFNYSFDMPPMSATVSIWFYMVALLLIVLATLAATALAGYKMAGERPANLLRPKPPKAGKKVILERIPFIWNKLSFKYKSTLRNVLRYKSRFFMTVIAVAFSTALVMAGLGLVDMCLFQDFGSGAILGISALIVIFAGLLTAVVIYTLTNINISERNREIATLMVLGYHNKEVTGYIYREIYINSFIGILFGYPLSAFFMWLVFRTMGLGSVGEVSWFMWLIAPAIVLLFTGTVTLILRRKIVKINMNESLKAIE